MPLRAFSLRSAKLITTSPTALVATARGVVRLILPLIADLHFPVTRAVVLSAGLALRMEFVRPFMLNARQFSAATRVGIP